MSKHTPGPWVIATSNSWRRIVSQRGDVVCGPCNQPDGHPDLTFPNGGAEGPDARLIAAAPELLEALVKARAALEIALAKYGNVGSHDTDWGKWDVAESEARAAIAKATGEHP